MSLDVVDVRSFAPLTPPYVGTLYYDDNVGVVTTEGGYGIAQLDGSITYRAAVAAGYQIVPEIGTRNAWWTSGAGPATLHPAELRTGAIAVGDYDAALIGKVVPNGENPYVTVLAILPDRILCVIKIHYLHRAGYSYLWELWLASYPRSASAPQEFTYEYLLSPPVLVLDGPSFKGNVCASDDPNCIWIGPMSGDISDDNTKVASTLWKYNFVTKKVVQTTSAMYRFIDNGIGGNDNAFEYLGWSSAMKRLLLFTSYDVHVVDPDAVLPYTISAPERADDGRPMKIVSITPTNPTLLKTERPLTTWMAAAGVQSGDKVFLSFEPFYSGYKRRFIASTTYGGYQWTGTALTGRTWQCTIVDDRTISIAADAVAARSQLYCDLEKIGATSLEIPSGMPVSTTMPVNTGSNGLGYSAYQELPAELEVRFGPVWPDGHPLSGQAATIKQVRKWHEFDASYTAVSREIQIPYFLFDKTGWDAYVPAYWADEVAGYLSVRDDLGPMPVFDCYMTKARQVAALIHVDLRGANPVYTVDNPTWLDDLGVVTTTTIKMEGERIGFTPPSGTNVATYTGVATRVAADKFSIALDPATVGYTYTANSFSNTVNAILDSYHLVGLSVGDTVKLVSSAGMPGLVGTVFHITEVITDGLLFRTDLDCSAYGSPQGGTYMPLEMAEFSGHATVTAVDFPDTYNTDAKIVRTRVLGSRKEPCVGRPVSWSATDALAAPSGTFKENVTLTDAEGYAYAVYYPVAGANGNYTITASVDTP